MNIFYCISTWLLCVIIVGFNERCYATETSFAQWGHDENIEIIRFEHSFNRSLTIFGREWVRSYEGESSRKFLAITNLSLNLDKNWRKVFFEFGVLDKFLTSSSSESAYCIVARFSQSNRNANNLNYKIFRLDYSGRVLWISDVTLPLPNFLNEKQVKVTDNKREGCTVGFQIQSNLALLQYDSKGKLYKEATYNVPYGDLLLNADNDRLYVILTRPGEQSIRASIFSRNTQKLQFHSEVLVIENEKVKIKKSLSYFRALSANVNSGTGLTLVGTQVQDSENARIITFDIKLKIVSDYELNDSNQHSGLLNVQQNNEYLSSCGYRNSQILLVLRDNDGKYLKKIFMGSKTNPLNIIDCMIIDEDRLMLLRYKDGLNGVESVILNNNMDSHTY